MRMWMLPVGMMCMQHIVGEHRELHTIETMIRTGANIKGYLDRKLLEPQHLLARHMQLEGLLSTPHLTPIVQPKDAVIAFVDKEANQRELVRRCAACRILHERIFGMAWNDIPRGGDKIIVKPDGTFRAQYSGIELTTVYTKRDRAVLGLEKFRKEMGTSA